MYWTKKAPTPGEFDLYYEIYETFWGKPLNIEQQAVSADDGDGMVVEESFNVLTIHARLHGSGFKAVAGTHGCVPAAVFVGCRHAHA